MEQLFEFSFRVGYVLYEGTEDFKIVQTAKNLIKYKNKEDEKNDVPVKISITGIMPGIRDGDFLHAYGTWVYSKKYGWGIKAEGCSLEIPSNVNGVKQFLCRFCRGIGETTAKKIIEKFGEDSISIITDDYMQLTTIPRITEKKAKAIHNAIIKYKSMEDLSVFMFSHGCTSYSEVLSIYKVMGAKALDKILSNPYSICREVGVSKFPIADCVALSCGYDANGPERLKNIITFFLSYRENTHGDMFVWMKKLPLLISQYLDKNQVPVSSILYDENTFMQCLLGLQQEHLITLVEHNADYCVFLKKNYDCEIEMVDSIKNIGFQKKELPVKNFDNFIKKFQEDNGLTLADTQIEAIYKSAAYRLSLITGGAGTGKTTAIRGIIAFARFNDENCNIALISPTGRASKRMTEVTGEPAMTIHRFLGITPETPYGSSDEILDVDYIICDESSMASSSLFNILFKTVRKTKAHLILVGDVNQLAPVGAGLPFKDMLFSNTLATTVLSTLFRQEEQSLINVNAIKVLSGDISLDLRPNRTDFNFFPLETQDDIKQLMIDSCSAIVANMGYSPKDIIFLSPMNRSLLGVFELNNFLQPKFNKKGVDRGVCFHSKGYNIYEGDRVMQTSNNYDLDVFNGDIGYVKYIDKDAGEIGVEFDDVEIVDNIASPIKRLVVYNMDDSAEQDLVLSYACTVHKAQGCEFPIVFMPIHPMLVNLSRTLLYTAITRARDIFACFGDYQSLCKGIQKDEILHRNTLLQFLLIAEH